MDVLRLIEGYQLEINNFQSKDKISNELKQKINNFIKQNKEQLVLIETFGSKGYNAFIYNKKNKKYCSTI